MRQLKKQIWPFSIKINTDYFKQHWFQIEDWLEENIGEFTKKWYLIENGCNMEYYFSSELDALVFSLRWKN